MPTPSRVASANLTDELRRAQDRYRWTFEKAPIGVVSCDLRGFLINVNEHYCALVGRSPDELRGAHFSTLLDDEDVPSAIATFEEFIRSDRDAVTYDRRYQRPDNTVVWANITLARAENASGELAYVIVLAEDITGRVAREEQLRRNALQQAAVANMGQTALSGMSVEFLLSQTATFVATVLDVEFCEILRQTGEHLILVAGEGWDEGAIGSTMVSAGRGSQAAFTLDSGHPVILSDIATEKRFVPSDLIVRHGIAGGLTVAIHSDENQPWGVLGAYSRAKKTFSTSDVDFLRTVAIVLGQAIERARADAELRTRASQQSAIAELGRLAITRHSMSEHSTAPARYHQRPGSRSRDFRRGRRRHGRDPAIAQGCEPKDSS